jgi:predicted enzyme related to lactoylglutathione lyase
MGIAFAVRDIEAMYERLKARGVTFVTDLGEQDWGRYAHFVDHEGNELQIHEANPGFDHFAR